MAKVQAYQLQDGTTRYMYQAYIGTDPETGKKKNVTKRGFKTAKEARKAATKIQYAVDHDTKVIQPSKRLFSSVAEEYWSKKSMNMRESTIIDREVAINLYVLPDLKDYRIGMLSEQTIRNAVTKWKDRSLYLASEALVFVKSVLNYCVEQLMIGRNPAKAISSPKPSHPLKSTENVYWNREQMDKFLKCIDRKNKPEDYMIFRLLAYTGIRHGELVVLQWGDIDLEEGILHVCKTLSVSRTTKGGVILPPKTDAGNRYIPLDNETLLYLLEWKQIQAKQLAKQGFEDQGDEQFVFTGVRNQHYAIATIPFKLKKIIDDNDLKPRISIHKFRHSYISNMLIAGVPPTTVQRLAGHTNPDVTLGVYAHISNVEKREAASVYAQYMGQNGQFLTAQSQSRELKSKQKALEMGSKSLMIENNKESCAKWSQSKSQSRGENLSANIVKTLLNKGSLDKY
jgi:integrase